MNQKGFASIILVIVAVLVLLGGGYYVVKNSKNTNNSPNPTQNNNDEIVRQKCGEQNTKIASLKTLNAILATYLNDHTSYPKSLDDLDNYGTKVTGYSGGEYLYAYYPATNPKYYHAGISIKVLSECGDVQTFNLRSDSDFDSAGSGYVNGFSGNDPIYDFTNKTSNNPPPSANKEQSTKDIPSKISVRIDNGGVSLEKMNGSVVVISWQYSGKSIKGGFTVERKLAGGSYQVIAQKYFSSSYYDKMAEEKNTYFYRVKANYTDIESSPYSDEISIAVPNSGTEISSVVVNTTNNSAEVSFVTTGDTKGSVQYQYDGVHYLTAEETDGGYKTNHKITVPNLNSGISYKYRIIVGNKQGVYRTTDFSAFVTK